ncbi:MULTISPECIES: SMI1/KNR4 family protein [Streptomyces]|uniref:SMI1/KNR4 family protein n=1 Tax=Streptomyces TaxID=1883 RepID=UPI0014878047|nr:MULTISPECIES: SMI1/KNR4 family protein [Streptomyces]
MSSVERLKDLLGVPPRRGESGGFSAIEAALGVELPQEVKGVCSLYGDVMISDFIFVFGPECMVEKSLWMSEFVREGHPAIPKAVLPDAGGMLHWGHSIEGDQFFLEDQGGGKWIVSAFRRNWGDWYESDESIADWLVGVFAGRLAVDWMPEWPTSHWFEV